MIRVVHWRDRMNIFKQRELRNIKDFDDLQQFLQGIKGKYDIRTKRGGKLVFGFEQDYNKRKCTYCINDGYSMGSSRYENLHRVLFVEEM